MVYIPVSMGYSQAKGAGKVFGKNLIWWDSSSVFYYPFVLYSAYPYSRVSNLREKEFLGKDITVFCDSGGYQVHSLGIKLDREEVFEWQVKNGDINFALDKPPIELAGKEIADFKYFEEDLDITYRNAKWYGDRIERYKREGKIKKQKFALITQCLAMEQAALEIDRLFDIVEPFDVISVASHTKDSWNFMSGIMYWKEKLDGRKKDLHLLGISGNIIIPVLSYVKKFWNGRLTFDSSTFFSAGKFRSYMGGILDSFILSMKSGGKDRKTFLPCLCPYCSLVRDKEIGLDDKGIGVLLSLHNLYIMVNRMRFWDWLVRYDEDEFRRLVKKTKGYDYLEFIDRCLNYGWKRAIKSFWWVAGSKSLVKSRERESSEIFEGMSCFGNCLDLCKGKCDYYTECKKVRLEFD